VHEHAPGITALLQFVDKVPKVDDPVASMGKCESLAGLDVLAVRHLDVRAQERKGVVHDRAHILLAGIAVLEQVGDVHDDLEPRRIKGVEQFARFLGCVYHIAGFGLDSQQQVETVSHGQHLLHGNQQILPGIGFQIAIVPAPHVLRVARACAERHEPAVQRRAGCGDRFEPFEPCGARPRVWIDHVVGAAHGGDLYAVALRLLIYLLQRARLDVLGQWPGQHRAQLQLHLAEPQRAYGLKQLRRCRSAQFTGQHTQFHGKSSYDRSLQDASDSNRVAPGVQPSGAAAGTVLGSH